MWEALGLLGILALWATLGLVPGCAAAIAARGRAPLLVLPLSMVAGLAAGALTPALGGKDAFGFGISLAGALAAGTAVALGVRMMQPQIHTDGRR